MNGVAAVTYSFPGWIILALLATSALFIVILWKHSITAPKWRKSLSVIAVPGIIFTFVAGLGLLMMNGKFIPQETEANLEEAYGIQIADATQLDRLHRQGSGFTSAIVTTEEDEGIYSVVIRYEDGLYTLWVDDAQDKSGRMVPFEPYSSSKTSR